MADITIVASAVEPGSANPGLKTVNVAETVTAGQPAYKVTGTTTYGVADALTASKATVEGIYVTGGASGGYAVLQTSGTVDLGAVMVASTTYILSDTGGIAPIADLATGDTLTILGKSTSTSLLPLAINNTGVLIP